MKKFLLLILLVSTGLSSCGSRGAEQPDGLFKKLRHFFSSEGGSTSRQTSTGKPYEVFVVMDEDKWAGETGDSLRSIFWVPFPMINQYEPFYATFQAPEKDFLNLLRRYRNVLVYKTGSNFTKSSLTVEYDRWAAPQVVVYLTAQTDSAAVSYMNENRDALLKIFDIAEMDRFIARAKQFDDKNITNIIREQFGLKINVPRGYRIAHNQPDFMWLRYEAPLVSQGIVIYKYPLASRRTFTGPYLLEKRNEFLKRIPGPSAGSYMTTSDVMLPELSQVEIDGRIWFRSQGFWDVEGGFMGGPFSAYSTVNAATREVITIDTWVFSPKYDKRGYVRQLQAIVQTASIPGDTVRTVNFAALPE